MYQALLLAVALDPADRTPTETKVILALREHIRQRRIHIATIGLAMYDAWKVTNDRAKAAVKQSGMQVAFDYGTVPLDFHATLGATVSLAGVGVGVGVAGASAASVAYANQMGLSAVMAGGKEVAAVGGDVMSRTVNAMLHLPVSGDTTFVSLMRSSDVFNLSTKSVRVKDLSSVLRPLNLFKGTAVASAALAGSTAVMVAFAIIQSVAIDQFLEIVTARAKLQAAMAAAEQPITLSKLLAQPNGADLLLYHWAKTMDSDLELEDPTELAWAAAAHAQAQASGYRLPAP